jgi:hypothetical protein
MCVRVSGQRFTRRAERSLLASVDGIDLRAVEHEHGFEQHHRVAGLLARHPVALLERQRGDDLHRALTLPDRIAHPQPGVEPRDERGVRSREGDQQLVGDRQSREPGLRSDTNPTLPPLRGQQLLRGDLEALAVLAAALCALLLGQSAR